MDKDYNAMFQLLVNKAIKDGWTPIWIHTVAKGDCVLGAGDIAAKWFYFSPPQEIQEKEISIMTYGFNGKGCPRCLG